MPSNDEAMEFNANATFWLRMNRVYRVYATDQELYFIRIGGQAVDWSSALRQLGILGVWIGGKLDARREAALASRAVEADRLSPQVLVNQHPHSFRLGVSEIESASFEPGSVVSLHGGHVAVWRLALKNGQRWRFQFDGASEASAALRILSRILGPLLVTTAVWDRESQRFVKARAGQPAIA